METIPQTARCKMKVLACPVLSALLCLLARAEETQSNFKFGDRGADQSVIDPTGVLTLAEQQGISQPLREILAKESIDVVVVVLPEIGDAPPEHVVRGFGGKWAKSKINAVVLHVPGRDGSPWILPGELMRDVVKPGALKEAIAAAEKRAAAEPTDFAKVRAASIEAADVMRYWKGGALLRAEDIITKRLEWQLANERRERLLKLAAALAAAAVIPLLVGAFFLHAMIRNSRPRSFPALRKMGRFGAPYSGGNSACSKPIR